MPSQSSSIAALLALMQGGSNGPLGAKGMLEYGNIDPWNRPIIANPNGGVSSTLSASFNFGDGEVLLPTVADDRKTRKKGQPQGHFMTPEQTAKGYLQGANKGKHLGRFDSPENADKYAELLHNRQEQKTINLLKFLLSRGL